MTALYIRNRHEAGIVARIARELGRQTSIRDIYAHDRFLINLAERLFGASPEKVSFVRRAQQEVLSVRLGFSA